MDHFSYTCLIFTIYKSLDTRPTMNIIYSKKCGELLHVAKSYHRRSVQIFKFHHILGLSYHIKEAIPLPSSASMVPVIIRGSGPAASMHLLHVWSAPRISFHWCQVKMQHAKIYGHETFSFLFWASPLAAFWSPAKIGRLPHQVYPSQMIPFTRYTLLHTLYFLSSHPSSNSCRNATDHELGEKFLGEPSWCFIP